MIGPCLQSREEKKITVYNFITASQVFFAYKGKVFKYTHIQDIVWSLPEKKNYLMLLLNKDINQNREVSNTRDFFQRTNGKH